MKILKTLLVSVIGCAVLFLVYAYMIVTEFWDDKNAV